MEKKTYHSGVLLRSPIISHNSQGVRIPLLSVQQASHCDTALRHDTNHYSNIDGEAWTGGEHGDVLIYELNGGIKADKLFD